MSLFNEIVEKSGFSAEEIKSKIEEKKSKFKNLLSEETATFLVAKELDVKLDDSDIVLTPINSVDEGSKGINILVNLKSIFPKKDYENSGKSGFLRTMIVKDDNREIALTLWNKDVDFKVGDILLIKDLYATKYKDQIRLNGSTSTQFILKGHKELQSVNKSVSELNFSDNNVDVEGVVYRLLPLKSFDYNGEQKSVLSFMLYDNGQSIPAVVWGDLSKEMSQKIKDNMKIKLSCAYVKNNRDRKELHLGEKGSFNVLEEFVELNLDPPLQFKELSNLAYDENVKVRVKIKDVVRKVIKDNCAVCSNSMTLKEGRLFCENCNDFTNVNKKAIIVFRIVDESAEKNAVLFTKQTYAFLSANESDIEDKLNSLDVLNKEFVFLGHLKKTDFEDDFIVSRIF